MNKEELLSDVEAIFEKESFELKSKDTFNPSFEGELKYKNLVILKKLYQSIEGISELQEKFIKYTQDILLKAKEFKRTPRHIPYSKALLSFMFFLEIGKYDDAIKGLLARKNANLTSLSIIMNLPNIFSFCKPVLNSEQLKSLKDLISSYDYDYNTITYKSKALKTILTKRTRLVEEKLESSNVEINNDKQKVIEKINVIGINTKITEYLNDLESFIRDGKPKDYAGNIATLRNVICEFIENLAEKISKEIKEPIPDYKEIKNTQPIGRARRFIKEKFELTDKENQFIDKFIGILQDEGHSLYVTCYLLLAQQIYKSILIVLFSC